MMTSEPFLRPRLTGARFEGGAVPLEVLADFAVLSEMIVEVAKWKYREENPARKRVPQKFFDGLSLKLTGIEEGSAKPVITLFVSGLLSFAPAVIYFQSARQAVVDAVRAAEHNAKITAYLPAHLLGYFDRFGRNLMEGEAIELPDASSDPAARLTKESRRKLILASSADEFTEETAVHGLVHDFDHRSKMFQMTLPNGTIVSKIPVEGQHYDTVLEAHNGYHRERTRVRVYGIGRFDRNNRLLGIEMVEHVVHLDPLDIGVRVDELKQLKPSWLDGAGLALAKDGLDWLETCFHTHQPDDLPLPHLFPTPDGHVLAEWALKPWAPTLEVDLTARRGDWHALNLDTDAEEATDLDLADAGQWKWVFDRIRSHGAEAA